MPHMQDPKKRDAVIGYIRSMRKTLCDLQAQITHYAAPFFAGNNLQRRWMSATPAKRGEIILAGLVKACTATASMHMARWYCEKELRVESHRQNGCLFLDLLEEMMVQNPTAGSPNMPTYISNPVWDAIVAQQASNATIPAKTALKSHLADRNMLIGFVVHFALCSILDIALPELYSTKSKPDKPTSQDTRLLEKILPVAYNEDTVKAMEKIARQVAKGVYAHQREEYARGKQECETCTKPNDTTTKYPHCKRCWDTMEREVLYCSSECEKVDWKAGHKNECGKLLQLEELTPSTSDHSPRIGPPLPGFKRSGALLFQVSALNQLSPDYEYLIRVPNAYVYFAFPHPPICAAVRACRDKALSTGDRRAVAMLAHFLFVVCTIDPRPQRIGVDRAVMMGQIMDEFQFPELWCAVAEMAHRMCLDAGRRPALIVDAGVSVAQWETIPSEAWMDVGIVPVPGS
ncbi:hypothetical protein FB45DRAFT_914677 [Roridomyces roridus]|uniref:MYND-type domain-containing protein n=1 Tax=Roridomyces roridus TaxID=1738132 RepID=A0AAD7BXP4_9AGAR|nr:hypothetical protein FB45DRAFT_914677 [Roridomyces roridus]